MKGVFKLIMFSIFLNLSVGLMQTAIPVFDNNSEYRGGIDYNSNDLNDFTRQMNGTINPTGDLEDSSNAFDRLLDKLNIGVIGKIINLIDKYMFGFINIMQVVLNLPNSIINFFKSLLIIGYVIASIWLWTGKDLGNG